MTPKTTCPVNKEYYVNKRHTAGIIVAAYSCGIIINFLELITSEGLTQIVNLIQDTGLESIKHVCYDNGCHLDSHIKNIDYDYPKAVRDLNCCIDRFHLKNHMKECQKYSCDNNSTTKQINSQVCEQLFYTIGKFKHITKHMNKYHFNFFLLQIFNSLNKNRNL